MNLTQELLFFKSQFFPFEFELLELFFVFSSKLSELDFALSEGLCLHLILIINRHNLLQIPLLSRQVSHQVSVLGNQLHVLSFQLLQSLILIFLLFRCFFEVHVEGFELVALFQIQLFRHVFVEGVLLAVE